MAAFVVLLVVVWGGGFLWFRGDLKPSADKGSDKDSDKGSQTQSAPEPSVSASPTAKPAAGGSYTGQVSVKQEKKAVDVNPTAPRPKPIALPPVATFNMATFNLLGSSHSRNGGSAAHFGAGTQRYGW